MSKFKNLVIFSTLNQITNYLVIQKVNPEKIFNITYEESLVKTFGHEISPNKWDDNLKDTLKDSELKHLAEKSNFEKIFIGDGIIQNPDKIKEKFEDYFKDIEIDEAIYWHITGGQRIYLIPIYEWLKDKKRVNDVIAYIEGNKERIVEISVNSEKTDREYGEYGLDNLNFKTAFKLMGYDSNTLNTTVLKDGGENKVNEKSRLKDEIDFYTALYKKIVSNTKIRYKVAEYEDCCSFMDLLLLSNSNDKFKEKENKAKFLEKVFEKIKSENTDDKYLENSPTIDKSSEMKQRYPAGYIFEKIVAYNIWKIIQEKPELNNKITSMALSQKVDFSEDTTDNNLGIIDELDIVLLTKTGKIINIECKSGGMTGDNAKSHHFTSYALSGVFGTPIFASPLYENGEYKVKETVDKLEKAFNAAEKAKLKTIRVDSLEKDITTIIGE